MIVLFPQGDCELNEALLIKLLVKGSTISKFSINQFRLEWLP